MQDWNSADYQRHAAFVPRLGAPLLDLLAPAAGERILDLGCGDGALTAQIAQNGVSVVGVDASPAMVEAARARGLDARVADGASLNFDREFDAVFSNAALHWIRDADAVIDGVRRALKPGGRFAAEFGGHGNVAAICVALIATTKKHGARAESLLPWYFPTADDYRRRLETHGFRVDDIALMPRPTPLPTNIGGWLDVFASGVFAMLPEERRRAARDDAIDLLRPVLSDGQGNWTADYVRLRFVARL
ncbi:class I SAM-dependent methyltransferase [Methylocystis sp. JAN1]|uniref:class I SAM-dependent methyltransferase n=1 Tax=Methylocystis sp. JAN1 TaxID=3397211 RepID=UPI003FA28741